VVFLLTISNFLWYVIASIGWFRYAFLGFALSGIFVAGLFSAIVEGLEFRWGTTPLRSLFDGRNVSRLAIWVWLLAIIIIPATKTVFEIAFPIPTGVQNLAAYLNANVPRDAVIETWETEVGFLTDHKYHFPPGDLLVVAVEQVYYNGETVQQHYDFVQTEQPEYLLMGTFSKWTQIYPLQDLSDHYRLIQSFGDYDLYRRIP
jgi:hypothetical protein